MRTLPAAGAPRAHWPFGGRLAELARLEGLVRSGASAVVAGPAGVGKTRLVHELAAALAPGAVVAVAATRATSAVPFGALAGPLHALAGKPITVPSDPVEAIQVVLDRLVRAGAAAVVLDDAHLLDDLSATVAYELVRGGRVPVVAVVRSGDAAPDPIVALWRDGDAERLDLEPLGDEDSVALVEAALGAPVDGVARRELLVASQGDVRYLRELVDGAVADGSLVCDEQLWRLVGRLTPSARLAELLDDRLRDLAPGELACLELLAVGDPLQVRVVEQLCGMAAAASLQRRGLLGERDANGHLELHLVHRLHGELVQMRLPAYRAAELRTQLADAVEQLTREEGADPLRVARWRLDAGVTIASDQAVRIARIAMVHGDLVLARRLSTIAWERNQDPGAGVILGDVLRSAGHLAESDALLAGLVERLLAEERAEGCDDEAAARRRRHLAFAAMLRALSLFWGLNEPEAALAVIEQVRPHVDAGSAAELVGFRATFDTLLGRPLVALATAEPLLTQATGRAWLEATIAAAPAMVVAGRSREAIELARRGFAMHVRMVGLPAMALPGIHVVAQTFALTEHGDLDEAEQLGMLAYGEVVKNPVGNGRSWFALLLGRIALARGKVATAARWFEEGAAAAATIGEQSHRRWCLASWAWVAALAGRTGRATSLLDAALATESSVLMMEPEVLRAAAWVDLAGGSADHAANRLRQAVTLAATTGAAGLEAPALHDLVRLGRATAEEHARLGALAARIDGRYGALAAADASARAGGDAAAMLEAADGWSVAGRHLLAAEAFGWAAGQFRRAGDARAAGRALRRSLAALAQCEGASLPTTATSADGLALTDREREVALAAAMGHTSRDIAASLFVSVRTVDNHLRRIYEKLGIEGRAELAADLSVLLVRPGTGT